MSGPSITDGSVASIPAGGNRVLSRSPKNAPPELQTAVVFVALTRSGTRLRWLLAAVDAGRPLTGDPHFPRLRDAAGEKGRGEWYAAFDPCGGEASRSNGGGGSICRFGLRLRGRRGPEGPQHALTPEALGLVSVPGGGVYAGSGIGCAADRGIQEEGSRYEVSDLVRRGRRGGVARHRGHRRRRRRAGVHMHRW